MTEKELEKRGEVARRVAQEAGDMLAERRAALGVVPYEVKGANDIVTTMDTASEEFIVRRLHEAFPDDDILAEEDGLRRHGGNGRWIIDPIDGTENFVRGFSEYAISVGYEDREGDPVVGAVYCPPKRELFWAVRGRGAWLGDKRVRVSEVDDPARAVSLVSPPFRRHDLAEEYFELYKHVFYRTCDVRNTGSAALHACYVAAGRAEGYFENHVQPFDIAAGLAIAAEAGGRWSSLFDDRHPYQAKEILLTNGFLHDWYREAARHVRGTMARR